MKNYTVYVEGMHCAACELLIERKAKKIKGVQHADAKLKSNKLEIKGDLEKSLEEFAAELTRLVEKDGYKIHTSVESKGKKQTKWKEFYIAIPAAAAVLAIFIALQKLGIVNIVGTGEIGLPAVFLIGIVASLSSCMAVVGGLVLSMSANYAKELKRSERLKPQIMFHVSRLIGFFILGGVIGLIGSAFTLSTTMTFIISLIVAFVMAILALNLLELFEWTNRFQFKMPKSLSHSLLRTENVQNKFAPIFLGAVTFFLPCGFTQSMQVYSLSTGSFVNGALTMFIFALGTLPILALISFASVNFANKVKSGVFFKTAGLIVLAFAAINLLSALVAVGVIDPIFNF
jgi:uncharacterized protein